MNPESVNTVFDLACERYAELGVDARQALRRLRDVNLSLHCWQGDDVGGFEPVAGGAGGGILSTGNFMGRAQTPEQLRADLDQALALIPGRHRLNLHAIYADTQGRPVDRDALEPEHFQSWIEWCRQRGMGMDFNPTFFSHPKAADGLTLSHPDPEISEFWLNHGRACRRIAAHVGRELGSPCVMNIWVPDGYKDTPVGRAQARRRLRHALDQLLARPADPSCQIDAVESKLFGIGAESCTVGSHEFYLGYAVDKQIALCLDSGHFHPTETVSDKLSAVFEFVPRVLLHVSRPVRWDSDHVVAFDDELQNIAHELVRGGYLERVHIGLDFFDATINRIAAWVIGARNTLKAMCKAFLEPVERLQQAEQEGDFTFRLALLEELKTMPFNAVWDYYCQEQGVPVGRQWLEPVLDYQNRVLAKRG